MIAGGRDPKVLHSSQYDLSAESGSRLLIIDTSFGRTEYWKKILKDDLKRKLWWWWPGSNTIYGSYNPLHFISMTTEVLTGMVMLLFVALHVSSAKRSSVLMFGIDKVFWTVCLYVPSNEESIKWLSLHHVTWGVGSPEKYQSLRFCFSRHVCW